MANDPFESLPFGNTVLEPERVKPKLPRMYKVLLLNDDYTPMEFVVDCIVTFFNKTNEQANQLMLKVHTEGKAICGVYPQDIAETKVSLVMDYANQSQHPLQCVVEPAD
jgi:ATP-dependent Clp protease adaptor protein ClpS